MRSLPQTRNDSKKKRRRRACRRRQFEHLERRDMFSGLPVPISADASGDFNGDGYEDVVSRGVRDETVEVRYGTPSGLSEAEIWSQDSAGILGKLEQGDRFGQSLAVGDFNGDGFDDLAIGVPNEDLKRWQRQAGAVNVIYGSPEGLTAQGNQVWSQDSSGIAGRSEAGDKFGHSLTAWDFDGDGCDDLVIGVPGENSSVSWNWRTRKMERDYGDGMVNVIYGSPTHLISAGNQVMTPSQLDDLWKASLEDPDPADRSDFELTDKENGTHITAKAGDSITIRLPGNPSTGYSWKLVDGAGQVVELDAPVQYTLDTPGLPGSAGVYTYQFKAVEPGATTLKLEYARHWDDQAVPADQFTVSIDVLSDSVPDSDDQPDSLPADDAKEPNITWLHHRRLLSPFFGCLPWATEANGVRAESVKQTPSVASEAANVATIARLAAIPTALGSRVSGHHQLVAVESLPGGSTPDAIDEALSGAQQWWDAGVNAIEALKSPLKISTGSSKVSDRVSGSTHGDWGSASGSVQQDLLGYDTNTTVDMDATDGNVGVSGEATVYVLRTTAEGRVETTAVKACGIEMQADAQGSATIMIGAQASAAATVGEDGLVLNSTLFVGEVLTADGKAAANVGAIKAALSGEAMVYVGAELDAELSATTEGIRAELSAFAGDRAHVSATTTLAGVSVERTAEAWAGVGCEADADLSFKDGKLHFELAVGAALGIGAKLGIGFTIDVNEMADQVVDAVEDVGQFVSDVGQHVSDAVNTVAHEAEKVGRKIGKFFSRIF